MGIVLWVLQVLLALAFLGAGIMKVSQPISNLQKNMAWVGSTPVWSVRTIGILEILGALGLILPAVTHILTWLTPVAAIGLALTMIGAIILHIRLKETNVVVAPLILLILALIIVYGRFAMVPLT
jgi:uncharacterized membrane protein YphA (DoxX/SURF4 family)